MTREELQRCLESQADRLLSIAQTLSDSGRPLKAQEQAVCRTAVFPMVEELTRIILSDFLAGNNDQAHDVIDDLHKQIEMPF